MKKYLLLIILTLQITVAFGQLSIYSSMDEGAVGYSIGATNENFVRDNNALNDCKNKGGKNPKFEISNNGYGCYAIVKGRTSSGTDAFGASYGGVKTVEECISDAKSRAMFQGATEKSLYVYAQGCITAPAQAPQNTTANTTVKEPEYGEWKKINSSECDFGIEYRTKRVERFQLNYQLWFYYQVRNISDKSISFTFNLVRKGKVEFSHPHALGSGGSEEFMHKMTADYIDAVKVTNVINTKTNKSICDDSKEESNKELINELNGYLHQIDDNNPTKKAIMQRLTSAQNSKSISNSNYINLLKGEIENAKRLLESLGKTTASQNGSSDDLKELWQKQTTLVKEIKEVEPNSKVYAYEGNITDKLEVRLQKTKENVTYLENYLDGIKTNAAKEKEAQEKQKAAEKDAFNSNMQKGDEAMGTKNYASAMSHYQTAKSSTTDANDQATAQSKYNQAFEAKKSADREVRVAEAKERDKKEDLAYTSMAAGTAGLMGMIHDAYSSRGFSGKFLLGLGYQVSPILSNNSSEYSVNKSYIETRNLVTLHTGFNFGVLNNKPVSIYLKPEANLGMSAFMPGISGGFVSYGGSGVVQLAIKKHSKFNVFGEGGWMSYDGIFKYDADAQNNTATDDVREGKMKYTALRYGGGFMLRWIDDGKETYLRPAVFYEKPSFFTDAVKPVLSMNLQINIFSEILLDFTYTPKTYIPGELLYPATLEKKNVNYFGIKIIRQGRLN